MKHVGLSGLDALDDVLSALRAFPQLKEKKRGIFYRKSIAFLHFHEDPSGLYADVKNGEDFEQVPVSTPQQRQALLKCVGRLLSR